MTNRRNFDCGLKAKIALLRDFKSPDLQYKILQAAVSDVSEDKPEPTCCV